jgi:hypothetical protein
LLAHTDTAFHEPELDAAGLTIDYFAPWLRILEQGQADGSLPPIAEPRRFAVLVSETVLFSYVHLRAHHRRYGWTPEQPATPSSAWSPTVTCPDQASRLTIEWTADL